MAYCDRCDRYFPHDRALEQHEEASGYHHICSDCGKDFATAHGLKQHYVQSPRHHYCQRCDRFFSTRNGLNNHLNDVHHYCEEHGKIFDSWTGLKGHYVQSSDHYYCQYCDEHFPDMYDFIDHIQEEHFPCLSCEIPFETNELYKTHLSEEHHYCPPCERLFKSQANLNSHLNSSIHLPANVRCPGARCNRAFISASALLLHFESGTCPSGMTREQLNRLAVRADRNNLITNPSRLLTGPDGAVPPENTTTYATGRAWNGTAYECFLCHNDFRSLKALNAHLQSPRHQEKIYRCPQKSCKIHFRALSALCQHVENGSCGVRRFRQVQNAIDGLVSGMRSIAF